MLFLRVAINFVIVYLGNIYDVKKFSLLSNCVLLTIIEEGEKLTLYFIDSHFDASTTDSFLKHCGKWRNCS